MNKGNPNPVISPNDPNAQLEQTIQGYAQQPPPLPEPPQTFVIECNKVLAAKDGHAYNLDDNTGKQTGKPNVWTNNFHPIKLKKGDMVSVNSAFLSSRGGGDLLQFNTSNNKTRILFEYYATNDKTNGKRCAIDIKGSNQGGDPYHLQYTLNGKDNIVNLSGSLNCYPANYRPMKLYRLLETYKEDTDFTPAPAASATIPFTGPQFTDMSSPYYTPQKEPNWGFEVAEKYIVDCAEDAYIPGLYRTPLINVRQNMFYQDRTNAAELNPDTQHFTGLRCNGLNIWYVANNTSLYGTCNADATMRIYFGWGKRNTEFGQVDCGASVLGFLGRLRVGETIQWLNTENWCGTQTPELTCGDTIIPGANGKIIPGPNVYTCTGYGRYGAGPTGKEFTADKFTQLGRDANGRYPTYQNPMGMFQKIVRINTGAQSHATAARGSPLWRSATNQPVPTKATPYTHDELNELPWIEVYCAKSCSIVWGDPNNWNRTNGATPAAPGTIYGVPTQGLIGADGFYESIRFLNPLACLTVRTWTMDASPINGTYVEQPAQADYAGFQDFSTLGAFNTAQVPPEVGPKQEDKYYLAYLPKYNSPTTLDVAGYMRTGPYQSASETQLSTGVNPTDYLDKIGLGDGVHMLNGFNYNFSTVGKNYPVDNTIYEKYGWDMGDDANYAGGRTPSVWQPEKLLYSDATYSHATTKGFSNQGDYIWHTIGIKATNLEPGAAIPAPNPNGLVGPAKPNTWLCVLTEGTDNENRVGSTWAANPNSQVFWYSSYDGRSIDARNPTSNKTQHTNPGGETYIKNQDSKSVRFFCSFPISDNALAHYDNSHPVEITAGAYDHTVYAANQQQQYGVQNYVCQVQNLPQGYYNKDVTFAHDENVWLPTIANPQGPFYGYDADAAVGAPATWVDGQVLEGFYKQPSGGTNEKTVLDYPAILQQFPQEFYAKFTNPIDGSTEIMYCKTLIMASVYANQEDTTAPGLVPDQVAAAPKYFNPVFLHPTPGTPADDVTTTTLNAGATANQVNKNYSRPCCLIILQRDCGGTGLKSFPGVVGAPGANTGVGSIDPYRVVPISNTASYFEILNAWAQSEIQFELNGINKELLNFTPNNMLTNLQYLANFAEGADGVVPGTGTKPRNGLPCGGDFYLCKTPNLPFTDLGIHHYNEGLLRLNKEVIKFGQPTRAPTPVSGNSYPAHTGKYTWGVHYDYVDIELDPTNMYSPTDVSNLVTEQLHAPADLYYSYKTDGSIGGRQPGGQVPYTANKYKLNSLFRQIHGPSTTGADGNTEDYTSGWLQGLYKEGEFCYFSDINTRQLKNSVNASGWKPGSRMYGDITEGQGEQEPPPPSGLYPVWLPNPMTFINVAPSTNFFKIPGMANAQTSSCENVLWSNYDWNANAESLNFTGKDIVICPEFAGTSNAQLNYNTDLSRFEWKFLHQPVYSDFTTDDTTGNSQGGKVVCRSWATAMDGVDNWDRHGGVNVVNWTIPIVEFGQFSNRRDQLLNNLDPLTAEDSVGVEFMNKLGFTTYWMRQNRGQKASGYDDTNTAEFDMANDYFPLGTTRSDIDVSETRPYTQISNRFSVGTGRPVVNFPQELTKTPADVLKNVPFLFNFDTKDKSILQGMYATDYNYDQAGQGTAQPNPSVDPATGVAWTGKPINYGWKDGYQTNDTQPIVKLLQVGAAQAYSPNGVLNTPPSVVYADKTTGNKHSGTNGEMIPVKLNLDDIKHSYMESEVDSGALRATELPKKTNIGYFLILSDLIDKHEFIGSANDGAPLKCLGILSKNYENNDFFFSFQSPVQFYVKQDRVITSIRTEIVTPSLTEPVGLDFNSSIIYTVVRQQTEPEADVAPMALTQAYDYSLMEQMSQTLGVDMTEINGALIPTMAQTEQQAIQAGVPVLDALRQNLVQAVLQPNDQQAAIIGRTQTEISDNLARMSLRERMQLLTGMGLDIDPTAAGLPPGLQGGVVGGINIQQLNEPVVAAAEHASGYGMSAQATLDAMDATRQRPAQSIADESIATRTPRNRFARTAADRDIIRQAAELQTGSGGRGRRGAGVPEIPQRIQDPGVRDMMETLRGYGGSIRRGGSIETHVEGGTTRGQLRRSKSTGSLMTDSTALSSAMSDGFPALTPEQQEQRNRLAGLNLEMRTGGAIHNAQTRAIGRAASGGRN